MKHMYCQTHRTGRGDRRYCLRHCP